MLTFLRRVDLIQPPLTLNHRKVVVFVILGCFSWGEQRRGAGGFLCVGFAILAFSFCVVVDLFVGFLGFFLIILNVLLLASPKRRLLRSYERNHLERGGRVKREKSPKTVCSQSVHFVLFAVWTHSTQGDHGSHFLPTPQASFQPSFCIKSPALPASMPGTQACPMLSFLPFLPI